MKIATSAKGVVLYMEADMANPGGVLFSDYVGMKSLSMNGTVENVTINIPEILYDGRDWSDETYLTAFHQISETVIAVAGVGDSKGCIRLYNRESNLVDDVIGHCNVSGFEDGFDAYFEEFYQMTRDTRDERYLLVTDQWGDALRAIDLHNNYYTHTVHSFYPSHKCQYFTQISNNFYLNCHRSSDQKTIIMQVTFPPINGLLDEKLNIDISQIVLKRLIVTREIGHADGHFSDVLFDSPQAITHLAGHHLILADEYNNVLRKINLETKTVSTICNGQNKNLPGNQTSCSLIGPVSLLVVNHTLMIGAFQTISKFDLIEAPSHDNIGKCL